MPFLGPLLWGVGLPALVAALVLAAGRLVSPDRGGRQAMALAVGLGYAAGHAAVAWPSWPPLEVIDRVPFLVLGVMVLGLFETTWPAPAWATWENRILVSLLTVVLIVGPAVQETWGTRANLLRLACLGAGLALAWGSVEALTGRVSGLAVALPLFVTAAGAAVVIVISGSLVSGRLAGVLAAALAGCAVLAAWDPRPALARGGVAAAAVALASLLLVGHVYSSTPALAAILLALAPLAAWIVRVGPLRRLTGWKAALTATAAALVTVGLAVGLAVAAMPVSEY